ncbi:MAG: hypothetical protein K5829_04215 [Treponema sp.]|nr:hypothetical protein [Treponema sp.]
MKKIAKLFMLISAAMVITSCTYNGELTSKANILPEYSGIYDGAKSTTVTTPGGYGTAALEVEGTNDVVKISAASWMTATINLANKINAKDAKTMKVIAKVGEGFTAGDVIVMEFSSEDGKTSAITGWGVPTFMKDLSTSYKIYEVELTDAVKAAKSDQCRHLTAATGPCDWSKISSIHIDPRSAEGDIYIRDIIFE